MDQADSQGRTALHEATGRGFGTIVKLLIAHGVNIDAKDSWNRTPSQVAAACGYDNILDIILGKLPITDNCNHKALLASARLRNALEKEEDSTVWDLLSTIVDVTVPDFEGRTALHHTAFHGKDQLAKTLLERGADVHAKIADSAYRYRTMYESGISAETYQCQWVTPLHHAAGRGHLNVTKLLLNHGADLRAMGSQQYSPLNVAVHAGFAEVARTLLDYGAPLCDEGLDDEQPTLLYWAATLGYEDVLRVLLEHGVGSEAGTYWGTEALVVAVERQRIGVVNILEEHGFRATKD